MGKSKKQILQEAADKVQGLPEQEQIEILTADGFTEADIDAVMTLLTPEVEKGAGANKPAAKAKSGHPIFDQIQLYKANGKIEEGKTIKQVKMEAERAERLNSQSRNTLILYRLAK